MSLTTEQLTGHYIDGEWIEPDRETFVSENPATGKSLGTFVRGTDAEADRAVAADDPPFES